MSDGLRRGGSSQLRTKSLDQYRLKIPWYVPILQYWKNFFSEDIFKVGLAAALPNAGLSLLFKVLSDANEAKFEGLKMNPSVYGNFSLLMGLFIAFRGSQSYSRYWEGATACFRMAADLVDAGSCVFAFCRTSRVCGDVVDSFQHTLVRLLSILHVLILAELTGKGKITGAEEALLYEVIDPNGIDAASMRQLKDSTLKVELVFQWILGQLAEGQGSGIISSPPPILTRAFQELNSSMAQRHAALKLTMVRFPFPYTAATDMLLIILWLLTPIMATQWATSRMMVFALSFFQTFMLWSLNRIATELENPFGYDVNDLDMKAMHDEFNERLLLLLHTRGQPSPHLVETAITDPSRFTKTGKLILDDGRPMNLHRAFQAVDERSWPHDLLQHTCADDSSTQPSPEDRLCEEVGSTNMYQDCACENTDNNEWVSSFTASIDERNYSEAVIDELEKSTSSCPSRSVIPQKPPAEDGPPAHHSSLSGCDCGALHASEIRASKHLQCSGSNVPERGFSDVLPVQIDLDKVKATESAQRSQFHSRPHKLNV